jgi:hypothetical protein
MRGDRSLLPYNPGRFTQLFGVRGVSAGTRARRVQTRINCIHSRPQLRALEEHDSVHQETGPSHVTGLGAGSNLISST